MPWTFERVAGPFAFTEGPVWDGSGILFSDIPTHRFMRYDVSSETCQAVHTDTNGANGLKLGPDGRLYACEMVGRRLVRYDGDRREVIVDRYHGDRFNSPNDLAIHDGDVWFTDPDFRTEWEPDDKVAELDHRSVYRVDPDTPDSLTRVTFDTTQPNGLLVSPAGDRLYVAQSDYEGDLELRAYPILDNRSLGEYTILHDFSPHRAIDGMCLDEDGNIVACAGWTRSGPGPMIYIFSPRGELLSTHPTPDRRPTNCAFGDVDLRTLYVTGYDACLFRARTDHTGYLGAP